MLIFTLLRSVESAIGQTLSPHLILEKPSPHLQRTAPNSTEVSEPEKPALSLVSVVSEIQRASNTHTKIKTVDTQPLEAVIDNLHRLMCPNARDDRAENVFATKRGLEKYPSAQHSWISRLPALNLLAPFRMSHINTPENIG